MRSPQKSNRARGRGSRKGGGGGGGGNVNRVYESAGPEGKVRGTAQQIIEKYLMLARDAQTSGDRVASENFHQHAEHYQRVQAAALGQQQERRDQSQSDSDSDSDNDQDDDRQYDHDGGRERQQAQNDGGRDRHDGGRDRHDGDDRDDGNRGRHEGGRNEGSQERRGEPERAGAGDDRGSRDEGSRDSGKTVSGMQTIDSGEGDNGDDLLVAPEEVSSGRSRKRRSSGRNADSETPTAAENTADSTAD